MISHDAATIDTATRRKILSALKPETPGRAAKAAQKAEDRTHERAMLAKIKTRWGHDPVAHRAAVAHWRSLAPTRKFIEKCWCLLLAQQEADHLHDAIEAAARADHAPRHVARDLQIPIRRAHYLLTLAREDQARANRGEETHRSQLKAERARQWREIRAALSAPSA